MATRKYSTAYRHLIMLAVLPLMISGCGTTTPQETRHFVDTAIPNAHTLLNWAGTYQGILPCTPGCDGLATMLVLYPNDTYTLRTRRIGKELKDRIKKGKFIWLGQDNAIKLSSKSDQSVMDFLRVDRDALMLLAPSGRILTDSANHRLQLNKTGPVPAPPPRTNF